jgi:hypothetical protein
MAARTGEIRGWRASLAMRVSTARWEIAAKHDAKQSPTKKTE